MSGFMQIAGRSMAIMTLLVAAGCGDETTSSVPAQVSNDVPPGPVSMASYNGPGSNWEYDLHDDGTYQIIHSALPGMSSDLSVSGDFQFTAQGFVSMTVDAASGSDAPSTGSSLWALEIPGFALLLSPVSTADDNFIPMVQGDQCPNTDLSNNWINVRATVDGDAASPEGSYFGSLAYRFSDGATSLVSRFALSNGNPDQGSESLGNGYCRNGVVKTSTSDIYLSPTGSATVHVNAADQNGGQIIFALPKTTISSISGLDGSYAGILSDDGATAGQKVSPVVVSCSNGICTGDIVTDVDTGTLAGQPFTVDLSGSVNVPGPGLTTGQLQMNGSTGNIGCMVDENLDNVGQRMISCAGQSPTRSYRLFSLILASND